MAHRMALYLQDKHDMQYELEMAQYAEEKGFAETSRFCMRLRSECRWPEVRTPLTAMRENIEAIKELLTMEEVTYEGEFVHLDQVRLDVAYGETGPRNIPIYIGATGPKMIELTGEIADGVVLNYVVSPDYIREAVDTVAVGAAKSGKTIADWEPA